MELNLLLAQLMIVFHHDWKNFPKFLDFSYHFLIFVPQVHRALVHENLSCYAEIFLFFLGWLCFYVVLLTFVDILKNFMFENDCFLSFLGRF